MEFDSLNPAKSAKSERFPADVVFPPQFDDFDIPHLVSRAPNTSAEQKAEPDGPVDLLGNGLLSDTFSGMQFEVKLSRKTFWTVFCALGLSFLFAGIIFQDTFVFNSV